MAHLPQPGPVQLILIKLTLGHLPLFPGGQGYEAPSTAALAQWLQK